MTVNAILLVTVALMCQQVIPEIMQGNNFTIWQKQLEAWQTMAREQYEVIRNQTELISDLGKRMDQLMDTISEQSYQSKTYDKLMAEIASLQTEKLYMNKSMTDMKEANDNTIETLTNHNLYLLKSVEDMKVKEPANCASVCGRQSGVYTIDIGCGSKKNEIQVRCDMDHGGGWTVIQRRFNGSVRFDQDWAAYKRGFGSPDGEYWIGNDNLHQLTSSKTYYRLLVELTDHDDNKATALYENFRVSDESDNYRLSVGTFKDGMAGDSLSFYNGMQFSTYDNDNDEATYSTSERYGGRGGWWYKYMYNANVNGGVYNTSKVTAHDGIHWYDWRKNFNALKSSIMAIRPKDF